MYILVLFLLSDPSNLAVYSPGNAGIVQFADKATCEAVLKKVDASVKKEIDEPYKLECRKV
jgi:hypothetical protein